MAWGGWRVPESRLHALGNPRGRDVLEVGCGGARWSLALEKKGARVVGLDLSPAQLAHASRLRRRAAARLGLVRGNAERLPFAPSSFDLVFADWGGFTFADPLRTVPEAARVLRAGGRLVFLTSSPFRVLSQYRNSERMTRRLLSDYFGMHRIEYPEEVNFQLPYGEWIRLFVESGFVVEALVEIQPGPKDRSRYWSASEEAWARHWPFESLWQVRKVSAERSTGGRRRAQRRAGIRSATRSTNHVG